MIPGLDRGLLKTEQFGRLAHAQALDLAHHEDLAELIGQVADRFFEHGAYLEPPQLGVGRGSDGRAAH